MFLSHYWPCVIWWKVLLRHQLDTIQKSWLRWVRYEDQKAWFSHSTGKQKSLACGSAGMNIFSPHSSSCLWHISCSWRSEQAALTITASPRNILAQTGHHNPQRGMNHFRHEGTEDERCSCRAWSSLQHTSHLQESTLHLHVQNMSSLCKPLLLGFVNVLDPFIQKLHPTAFLWPLSASLVILHSLTAFHLTSWCSFNLPISLPPSCQMSQPCAWSQSLLLLWKNRDVQRSSHSAGCWKGGGGRLLRDDPAAFVVFSSFLTVSVPSRVCAFRDPTHLG